MRRIVMLWLLWLKMAWDCAENGSNDGRPWCYMCWLPSGLICTKTGFPICQIKFSGAEFLTDLRDSVSTAILPILGRKSGLPGIFGQKRASSSSMRFQDWQHEAYLELHPLFDLFIIIIFAIPVMNECDITIAILIFGPGFWWPTDLESEWASWQGLPLPSATRAQSTYAHLAAPTLFWFFSILSLEQIKLCYDFNFSLLGANQT